MVRYTVLAFLSVTELGYTVLAFLSATELGYTILAFLSATGLGRPQKIDVTKVAAKCNKSTTCSATARLQLLLENSKVEKGA